jgi:predicted transcriptional regulator
MSNTCKICTTAIKPKRIYCSNACKFSDKEYLYRKNEALRKKVDWSAVLKCPVCDWYTDDLQNKSGALTKHIEQNHGALKAFVDNYPAIRPLIPERKHESYDGITCLECNKIFKKLSNTHLRSHGLTPTAYKDKHHVVSTAGNTTAEKQRAASLHHIYSKIMTGARFPTTVTPLFDKDTFKGVSENRKYTFQCVTCATTFTADLDDGNDPICRVCVPKLPVVPTGAVEEELFEFISNLGLPIMRCDRTIIAPYEIDFYLPSVQVGIEYNGLYWHSEKFKTKDYHIQKTKNSPILLIQMFEDEWKFKQDIVKSKLTHLVNKTTTRLHARQCRIEEVTNKDTNEFLITNHLQGYTPAQRCFGAFYEGQMVACMTFGGARKALGQSASVGEYELIRFAVAKYTSITGIANKLFLAFTRSASPTHIISYADARWARRTNSVYLHMGFKYDGWTQPNYWYFKGLRRHHRFQFRKQKLIDQGHDPTKTEIQIMTELGYYRIWDCGSYRYRWNLK